MRKNPLISHLTSHHEPMKTSLLILACVGLGAASASAQNKIAIFKRAETVTGKYNSEQLAPAAGLAPLTTTVKLESYELIDLDAGQRIVITKDLVAKKFTVSAVQNTIGYSVMKLKVPGTTLWYRGAGESGQAEMVDNTLATVPGFDYYPDATGSSPAGDGIPDYFSTWQQSQAESGKAAPVVLKKGTVSVTLTVPKTITVTGDAAEQYEDQGAGDRGVAGSVIKGTVTFDTALSLKANTDVGSGTLTYAETVVRAALAAAGFTEVL